MLELSLPPKPVAEITPQQVVASNSSQNDSTKALENFILRNTEIPTKVLDSAKRLGKIFRIPVIVIHSIAGYTKIDIVPLVQNHRLILHNNYGTTDKNEDLKTLATWASGLKSPAIIENNSILKKVIEVRNTDPRADFLANSARAIDSDPNLLEVRNLRKKIVNSIGIIGKKDVIGEIDYAGTVTDLSGIFPQITPGTAFISNHHVLNSKRIIKALKSGLVSVEKADGSVVDLPTNLTLITFKLPTGWVDIAFVVSTEELARLGGRSSFLELLKNSGYLITPEDIANIRSGKDFVGGVTIGFYEPGVNKPSSSVYQIPVNSYSSAAINFYSTTDLPFTNELNEFGLIAPRVAISAQDYRTTFLAKENQGYGTSGSPDVLYFLNGARKNQAFIALHTAGNAFDVDITDTRVDRKFYHNDIKTTSLFNDKRLDFLSVTTNNSFETIIESSTSTAITTDILPYAQETIFEGVNDEFTLEGQDFGNFREKEPEFAYQRIMKNGGPSDSNSILMSTGFNYPGSNTGRNRQTTFSDKTITSRPTTYEYQSVLNSYTIEQITKPNVETLNIIINDFLPEYFHDIVATVSTPENDIRFVFNPKVNYLSSFQSHAMLLANTEDINTRKKIVAELDASLNRYLERHKNHAENKQNQVIIDYINRYKNIILSGKGNLGDLTVPKLEPILKKPNHNPTKNETKSK